MMGQRVGGSSLTGAKFPGRTWLGSTEGNDMRELMNLLTKSLKALDNATGNDRGAMGSMVGLGLVTVSFIILEVVSLTISVASTFFEVGGVEDSESSCSCDGCDDEGAFFLVKAADIGRRSDLFVFNLLLERQMGWLEVVRDSIQYMF